MKKFLSFMLCALTAFTAVCGTASPAGAAKVSSIISDILSEDETRDSASYNKEMLPYCYYKLTDEEKLAYLKLRTAFIDHEESLKISVPTETMEKISDIMMTTDVLTCFNIPSEKSAMRYYYNPVTGRTESALFSYVYSKKDYDDMIKKADEAAGKVISRFTDKTSEYAKIKYIHDYIIKSAEYDASGKNANSIYGALYNGKAKCDGYSHAFQYICQKAGIRAVTVLGKAEGETDYHAWNKVYYNKKWYNVDVTWDDPAGNLIDNISYRYFMISDDIMDADHSEVIVAYYVPSANTDGMDYYTRNGLCAGTVNEARDILSEEIYKAAQKGKSSVTVRFSDKSAYDSAMKRFNDTNDLFDIIEKAGKRANVKLITDGCHSWSDDRGMYVFTVQFYYEGTKLSDYFIDISAIDREDVEFLIDIGLENA